MKKEKAEISAGIDWYSLTCDAPAYHVLATMECEEMERGMFGYTIGVRFIDGRLEMKNPDNPQIRTYIQYNGSSLAAMMTDYNIPPLETLSLAVKGGKTTRLDLAIDVKMTKMKIGKLAKMVKQKKHVTTAKSAYYIKTVGGKGKTLYIGSPKSDIRCRIYDKAAEQGVSGHWTRIEVQLRHSRAEHARLTINAATDKLATISAIILGFIDFPDSKEWQIVFDGAGMALAAPKRTEADTEKWLLTTVANSIGRVVARDGAGEFLPKLYQSIQAAIEDHKSKINSRA